MMGRLPWLLRLPVSTGSQGRQKIPTSTRCGPPGYSSGGARPWHERITDPDVVISHRSAAHLRGLGDLVPHEHQFYAVTRLRPRRSDIKLRVRSQIATGSWEVWGGLPVRTVPAIIDDLLSDNEDESAVAQVVRDTLERGLLRRDALRAVIEPYAMAYGRSDPEEFLRILVGEVAQT